MARNKKNKLRYLFGICLIDGKLSECEDRNLKEDILEIVGSEEFHDFFRNRNVPIVKSVRYVYNNYLNMPLRINEKQSNLLKYFLIYFSIYLQDTKHLFDIREENYCEDQDVRYLRMYGENYTSIHTLNLENWKNKCIENIKYYDEESAPYLSKIINLFFKEFNILTN